MRTAILVPPILGFALLVTSCAPAAATMAPSAAPPDPAAVALAATAEGELTLDIAELI